MKDERFPYEILSDPKIFKSENCLPAHSDNVVYGNFSELGGESSLRRSLNGTWRFSWSANVASAPRDFFRPDADLSGFGTIEVPGHMQMQGYGVPQYANYEYPWDGREDILSFELPERFNPVGSYVRTFEVPEVWGAQPVFLRFEGVESGYAFWVDGKLAGYSEDTFTPSEFEITEFLSDGKKEHTLAVQVFTWTSSSWLEDQDFFRFSGIFRDVWLYTKTDVYPENLTVRAEPDDDYVGGTLDVQLAFLLAKRGGAAKVPTETAAFISGGKGDSETAVPSAGKSEAGAVFTAEFILSKNEGDEIFKKTLAVPTDTLPDADGVAGTVLLVRQHLPKVDLWSAEHPELYNLYITLKNAEGKETSCICQRVGFRRFEIRDGLMLLNGRRIVFNGVNRHEFSADKGRVPSPEDTLRDVSIMKENNINAVRTSHYQNDPYIYDLCDVYGLYMIAENNLETHGTWAGVGGGMYPPEKVLPGDHYEVLPLLKDRLTSTCELNKNHPSVLIWSLGNESSGGPVLAGLADYVRQMYPGRPIHYEGIFHDRSFPETSDMESQMYTPAAGIEEFLKEHPGKPFISCEYMHAMGNSLGGLFKYTDLAKREPRYQGGFIWDFVDQAIHTKNVFGEEYLAYGGDFGERPHDGNFCGDGIINAERRPYAKMQEVKYCYQNVDIFVENLSRVRFVNRFLFTDLSEFDGIFTLLADGEEVLAIPFEIALAPSEEVSVPMPENILAACGENQGREMVLTVSLLLKKGDRREIAFVQGLLAAKSEAGSRKQPCGEAGDSGCASEEKLFDACESLETGCGPASGACAETASRGAGAPVVFAMNRLAASEKASAAAVGADAGQGDSAMEGEDPWKAVEGILSGNPALRLIRGGFNVGAAGEDFDVLFSGLMGNLVSYRAGGRELLTGAPPRPNFWRAPNDNDRANGQPARSGIWKLASNYAVHLPGNGWPRVTYDGQTLEVAFRYGLPGSGLPAYTLTYLVSADGTVRCTLAFPGKEGLPPMPDFGLLFELSPSLGKAGYYGLGPEENYCDRNFGAKLGIFRRDVRDMAEPYLKPQETGNRTGVRWAEVTDEEGFGICFEAGTAKADVCCGNPLAAAGMNFSAIPWKPDELETAAHAYELPRSAHTYVRVSAMQMGVGGDDTWGAKTHPEFLPGAEKPVEFSFTFHARKP